MNQIEFDKYLAKLKIASDYYYNGSDTIMSDSEYDTLISLCRNYAKENNIEDDFLNSVGMKINGKSVIKHINRMYSQKDIFTIEEALVWANKKKSKVFYLEPKLDGCSCNLLYVNGKLKSIATRGDGLVGQDITYLKDSILNIPLTISHTEQIEIRGELVISFKNFLNFQDSFKNPRNMVAGSLSLLDTEEFKKRSIEFIPWGLGFNRSKMNKSELKPFFSKLGFKPIPYTKIISELSEINTYYKKMIKERNINSLSTDKKKIEIDYPIDGMMIYINKHEEQSFYGYGTRFPLFSIAFKFPAKEVSTKLLGVDYNIGRNGNLSITGILEPIELLGTTVSRATLHNLNYINKKDIKIGDNVIVYKAGDIIPAIKEPFILSRDGSEKTIKITKCPYCKSVLNNKDTILNCSNIDCTGILKSKLKFAVSKKCLNLLNIGDEFINKVVDSGYVKDVVDFYKLDSYTILKILRPQLGKLEDKDFIKEIGNNKYSKDVLKADVIYNTILSIYKKPFSVILESFSLPGLGTASCKRLESIGILNITDYIGYLNNNLNANNKRILETINNKIISNLKNIK